MVLSVFLRVRRVKARSGIQYRDHMCLRRLPGHNGNDTTTLLFSDAVLHRVFNQWLDCQSRNGKIRGYHIVDDLQFIPIAELLQIQIRLHMAQLFFEGNGLALTKGRHIPSQIFGKVADSLLRRGWVHLTELIDGRQRIIQEMGLNLAEHHSDAAVLQLRLQLLGPDRRLVVDDHIREDTGNVVDEQDHECKFRAVSLGVNALSRADHQVNQYTQ